MVRLAQTCPDRILKLSGDPFIIDSGDIIHNRFWGDAVLMERVQKNPIKERAYTVFVSEKFLRT